MEGAAEMMNVCADGSYDSPAWQYAALRYELYRAGTPLKFWVATIRPSGL